MSKLADAMSLNMIVMERTNLAMLSDSDLRYVKHNVKLRLTANKSSVRQLNLQMCTC